MDTQEMTIDTESVKGAISYLKGVREKLKELLKEIEEVLPEEKQETKFTWTYPRWTLTSPQERVYGEVDIRNYYGGQT